MPDDVKQQTNTAVTARTEKAIVADSGLFSNLMDTSRFEHLQRVANVFANSSLVPEHFKGKAADCFIAVEMAMRLGLHPFNLMQSLYVVHGKPGIEAKMAIALINSRGPLDGPLEFTLKGEGIKRECTASGKLRGSDRVVSTVVTMEMAKAEGWIDKSGSKWKTMPDIMLQYRSASFFARLYCPEVLFGMQTQEELLDSAIDVTPPGGPAEPAPAPRKGGLRERVSNTIDVPTSDTPPAGRAADAAPEASEKAKPAAQEPAGATQAPSDGGEAKDTAPSASAASSGDPAPAPSIPFEEVLKYAKKAKSVDQADIVRDSMREPGYTDAQREEVRIILDSKSFAAPKPE